MPTFGQVFTDLSFCHRSDGYFFYDEQQNLSDLGDSLKFVDHSVSNTLGSETVQFAERITMSPLVSTLDTDPSPSVHRGLTV